MKNGTVVLIRLPQVNGGSPKLRPALVLAALPGPYQNLLICGISTQLHELQPDWDELIEPSHNDFAGSGLQRTNSIRLSYLYAAHSQEIVGEIGQIAPDRRDRLRRRLIDRQQS